MSRLLDLDDFLDPKSLTPQELYKLQSETWEQGAEYERERIVKLLEDEKFVLPEGIDEGLTLMPIQEAIALIRGEKN